VPKANGETQVVLVSKVQQELLVNRDHLDLKVYREYVDHLVIPVLLDQLVLQDLGDQWDHWVNEDRLVKQEALGVMVVMAQLVPEDLLVNQGLVDQLERQDRLANQV
jgi:hypothetical protein